MDLDVICKFGYIYLIASNIIVIINLMKIDTDHFKEKLEKELRIVEAELKTVGRKNPSNPSDWEPTPQKMDVLSSDEGDIADNIEAYEENAGILKQLEIRYNEIKSALKKIKDGTFGVCETDGGPIEIERLEANPASTTCRKHIK